jgi:hypothetical protein
MVNGYIQMEDLGGTKIVNPRTGFNTTTYQVNRYARPYYYARNTVIDNEPADILVPTQIAAVTEQPKGLQSENVLRTASNTASQIISQNIDARNDLDYNYQIKSSVEPAYRDEDGKKIITNLRTGSQVDFSVDPSIAEIWGNVDFDWGYQRDRLKCVETRPEQLSCMVKQNLPSVVSAELTLMDRDHIPHFVYKPDTIKIIPMMEEEQRTRKTVARSAIWY